LISYTVLEMWIICKYVAWLPGVLRVFLIVLLPPCVSQIAIAQSPQLLPSVKEFRQWSDVSGQFKITASLEKVDDLAVHLRKDSGESVIIQKRRLSAFDKEFLVFADSLASNDARVTDVDEVVGNLFTLLQRIEDNAGSGDRGNAANRVEQSPYVNFRTTPSEAKHRRAMDDAAVRLVELYQNENNAIAGMMAGTLMAVGKDLRSGNIGSSTPVISDENRLKAADKYLKEGSERLKSLHNHFPTAHPMTLVSALNNRAVLSLKLGYKGRAATLMLEASAVSDAPEPVLIHNIAILSALSEDKNPIFSASNSQRKQMAEVLHKAGTANELYKLPRLFLYSTNYDGSRFTNTSYRASDLTKLNLLPEVTCFVCSGNGFLDCKGCVKGKTSYVTREPIGFNPLNGEVITGNKVRLKQCELCRSVGFFKCPQCKEGQIQSR